MSEVLPTGATFGGRWVIERPLSSGGMGGKRTNRSTGSIVQRGDVLILEVKGTFKFARERGAVVDGTFEHKWTLQRERGG